MSWNRSPEGNHPGAFIREGSGKAPLTTTIRMAAAPPVRAAIPDDFDEHWR